MRHLLRWYGAGPLHLLALLACFALAGYAAIQLVPSRPVGVAVWFVGAVIGHDLLLMPLYSLADRSALAVIRHRAPRLPAVASINYVRVPAALSGLLLLVWFPLIFRLTTAYRASTTLSPAPYLWHWLAVTGALFLLSAAAFAVRLRRVPQPPPAPAEEDQIPAEQDHAGRTPPLEGPVSAAGPGNGPEPAAAAGALSSEMEPLPALPEKDTAPAADEKDTAPAADTGRSTVTAAEADDAPAPPSRPPAGDGGDGEPAPPGTPDSGGQ